LREMSLSSARRCNRENLIWFFWQALRLAELQPPALAVLDVVMPVMGGASTACELLRRFPGLPVLFTSGFSENANNAMAQVPASHYLQKPYSRTSLASTIREILDHP